MNCKQLGSNGSGLPAGMLTFDGLVQDIIQRRGKLGSKEGTDSAQDYQEA